VEEEEETIPQVFKESPVRQSSTYNQEPNLIVAMAIRKGKKRVEGFSAEWMAEGNFHLFCLIRDLRGIKES
jgi:hypothetical protein